MNILNFVKRLILTALIAVAFNACQKTGDSNIVTNNIYDGVYNITFCNYPAGAPPSYPCSTTVVHMITTAPDKVKMCWPMAGAFGHPSLLNGTFSFFAQQEPEYTIDPATNAVTVQNTAPGAVTFYTMASGFSCKYDPAGKTFSVKFGYSYIIPGVFDPGCREWTQTITYVGPR